MSKSTLQGLLILGVLFILSAIIGGVGWYQKSLTDAELEKKMVEVTDLETRERTLKKQVTDLTAQAKTAKDELEAKGREVASQQQRADSAQKELTRLSDELDKIKRDRDDFDERIRKMRSERDDLTRQITDLKNRPPVEKIVEKIVYKDREVPVAAPAPVAAEPAPVVPQIPVYQQPEPAIAAPVDPSKANDQYWAGVMRQKAALEIELNKTKQELGQAQLKIAEMQKSTSDFEIEIGRLKNEKEEIVRKIKYGEELADNLSIELARARNDQKLSLDRASKIEAENQSLRSEIKQLTTTKVSLEKSIARLSDEKSGIEKKLVETENIIQGRIDEIWKIKKDIDTRFDARGIKPTSQNEIELPPIVVNANDKSRAAAVAPAAKKSGTVVSVNEENNFVIVDMGEKSGIKTGDQFKVYRNGNHVGAVQVIQVRADISAADIKQKNGAIQAGDIVK